MRDFWRGEPATLASSRRGSPGPPTSTSTPAASRSRRINFVTAHDGFTLRDLVSYNEKHNEANGEDNNDGESHNRSWNCGVEGPTDDPAIRALRAAPAAQLPRHPAALPGRADDRPRRRARPHPAAATTTSTARTTSSPGSTGTSTTTTPSCSSSPRPARRTLRREHPVFRRRRFFAGSADHGGESELGDIAWFTPDGRAHGRGAWRDGEARSLMVFLNGEAIPSPDPRGQPRARRLASSSSSTPTTRRSTFTLPERGVRRGVVHRGRHRAERLGGHARGARPATHRCASQPRSAIARAETGRRCGAQHRRPAQPARAGGVTVADTDPDAPGPHGDLPAAGASRRSGSTTSPPLAAYLADLGVSHAYLSPVLQAAPGSTHGYDVLDHPG